MTRSAKLLEAALTCANCARKFGRLVIRLQGSSFNLTDSKQRERIENGFFDDRLSLLRLFALSDARQSYRRAQSGCSANDRSMGGCDVLPFFHSLESRVRVAHGAPSGLIETKES